MAFLGENFNANDMPQDSGGFDPVPAGEYSVKITEADVKTTKAGNGQYINCRLDVIGPSHQGRVIWAKLNIRNPNPKAEEIGRQQLGSIMRALGIGSLQDTDQLVGGEMLVKVSIREDEKWGAQNDVKSFKAIGGSRPPAVAGAAAQHAAASAPPWARK